MKRTALLLFIMSASYMGVSQKFDESKFDLPPGNVFREKHHQQIDYSYKVSEIPSKNSSSFTGQAFLQEYYSQEEILEMKKNDKKRYKYFLKANEYHNRLSDKVKNTFTTDELWYIYIYDKNLREKLLQL